MIKKIAIFIIGILMFFSGGIVPWCDVPKEVNADKVTIKDIGWAVKYAAHSVDDLLKGE